MRAECIPGVGYYWSDERKAVLRALINADTDYGVIAQRMGISRVAVRSAVKRYGLAYVTDSMWTSGRVARLEQLWLEGHSCAEIGRRMGISKDAVVGKARRLGLPPRVNPIDPRRLRQQQKKQTTRPLTSAGVERARDSAPLPAGALWSMITGHNPDLYGAWPR